MASPIHPPTPGSNVADEHPPSPSEDYKLYSQMVSKIAKVLNLTVVQPPADDDDKVFDDISLDQAPPLRLAFIKPLLRLIKESWEKPSTVQQMPHRTSYRRCGDLLEYILTKHPTGCFANLGEKHHTTYPDTYLTIRGHSPRSPLQHAPPTPDSALDRISVALKDATDRIFDGLPPTLTDSSTHYTACTPITEKVAQELHLHPSELVHHYLQTVKALHFSRVWYREPTSDPHSEFCNSDGEPSIGVPTPIQGSILVVRLPTSLPYSPGWLQVRNLEKGSSQEKGSLQYICSDVT
ncbi:hypothetical protein JRQ81_001386 [Phrynocephalus forsythii]|uniref:Uncharacterized protein n=1 Tax=Phrynocephalus forsythii TaxID=171643 RepID=A0A9Q1B903_9SAUR|nr:hypothetical protein JRQ81_001386 [Phrynocephalus forsythii]